MGVWIVGFHPERGGVFVTEIALLVALYVSRSFIIAIKYGYMPDCDFAVIAHGEGTVVTAVQLRHQLLTGWVVPSQTVLNLELTDAAARHRIDLGSHSVKVPK